MRIHRQAISPEVEAILRRSVIDGHALRVVEQLERPMYLAVNKVLELLGGKWNKKAKAHLFAGSPIASLDEALDVGSVVDEKKTFNFFPTPKSVCQDMVDAAGLELGQHILEPSAGTGNILDAINDSVGIDVRLVAIEINSKLAHALRGKASAIDCTDFLELKMEGSPCYDRILMNPPFENGADIKHIRHALTFLKPGGRLVAICASGPRQNEQLKPLADRWEELPNGTFAGTGVRTVMLVINKPACQDCGKELGDAESMVRNDGRLSHLEPCRPALGQNEAEAERLTYGGRQMVSLKESKILDTQRLNESPLFKQTGRLF